uniref:ANK_REP_REGION domain-containing protein n=1 Tax=Mesocestoides corti TaxID=53468 RepID=A0A5K3F636_MESCO
MVETSNAIGSHAETNQSFLRAARSGNIGKITEFLNTNVEINAVSSNGLNALHLASKEGHLAVVRLLLDHHAAIDAKTNRGNTALHIASLAGRTDIVKLLVERGADVNARSQNGFTPLYMSSQENHADIVEYLLNHGADQALATDDGFTPLAVALQLCHDGVVSLLLERDAGGKGRLPALHVAAKKDDVHAVSLLLANNDINVNHASTRGFTPLHVAARYGNLKVARLLLSNGADVNYCAKDNITPLHLATKWGKSEMTQLLIDKGAQLDARTRDGLTPMHTAARSGHTNVVQVLINAGACITAKTRNGLSPLHMAAQSDHADTARLLLKRGSPPDDVTMDYLTPLHIAAHCGNTKVALVLLDHHCDPNIRAFNGFTPLHVACKKMNVKVVEVLLKKGATVDASTQAGLTPLHTAAFVGCSEAASLLLQRGANVDQTTMRGETPLHFAVRGRHVETIKVLLKHSASIDAKTMENATPLHIALRLRDPEIVKLLVHAKADVKSEARGRHQPIHLAAKVGDVDIIRLLIDNGSEVNAKTKRGYTALHIAAKYGRIDAMKFLLEEAKANVNAAARNGLTPLHVAVHYGYAEAVDLLISHGAEVTATCKNGFTPLHIAAKMKTAEIASSLLKAKANVDAVSQNGYSPLHLAALEGDISIVRTLVDDYAAQVSLSADDGLTPLHLAAQADRADVVEFLLDRGANQALQTRNGYTPLHEAAYRGNAAIVKLLLDQPNKMDVVNSRTIMGCTPLHLAAQQGHSQIVDMLVSAGGDPNSRTMQGWTAAQVARRQHYLNIFESLSHVTTVVSDWDSPSLDGASADGLSQGDPSLVDGSMVLDSPTQMLSRVAIESEDESDQLVSTPVLMRHQPRGQRKVSAGDLSLFKSPSFDLLCEQMEYTRAQKGEPKIRISALDNTMEEQTRVSELMAASTMSMGKSDVEMSAVTPADSSEWEGFEAEPIQAICKPVKAGFLVSFLVDARGGLVEAQRRPDLRFLIPPHAISSPTRIICRLLRPDRVSRLPHLNDGDAFACRIIEMSPSNVRFDGPILLEVPHFASIQGRDREVITLRCDHGDSWKSHPLEATDQSVRDALGSAFGQIEPLNAVRERRIQRILTSDVPQFFALISRFRQEISLVGPDGGVLTSTVAPKVQAVFPKGALQKRIKVGLQAQVIQQSVANKVAGSRVFFSPVVTLEPRRRKFHKPITVTIPLPRQPPKGTHKSEPLPLSLHLLCSITAGCTPATWEDITGSTAMTRHKDCISFTTTVSARLWLVDAPGVDDVAELASRVYRESIIPPYVGRFAVYARLPEDRQAMEANEAAAAATATTDASTSGTAVSSRFRRKVFHPADAELRCVCLIDDVPEKTLEQQEKFQLVAIGPPTEVIDSKAYWLETVGDISSYPAHAGQLSLDVQAFQENRLTYPVRVRQPAGTVAPPVGYFRVHCEPRGTSATPGEINEAGVSAQQPITALEIRMPGDKIEGRWLDAATTEEVLTEAMQPKLDIRGISLRVGNRWVKLAEALGLSSEDITMVAQEPIAPTWTDSQADRERCEHMLALWMQRCAATGTPTADGMVSQLTEALRAIDVVMEDVMETSSVQPVTSKVLHIDEEIASAKTPSEAHPIQLIEVITKQHHLPPESQQPTYVAAPPQLPASFVNGEIPDESIGPESPSAVAKDETPPPTAVDGTPRLVPGEEVPFITPSKFKTASLERPPSMVVGAPATQDDLSLPTDDIKPVVDEFIVASENLKRKNLFPSDRGVSHADSEARHIAAQELAEALGLDLDVELVSVVSQPPDQTDKSITEDTIEPVQSEPKPEFSPLLARPASGTVQTAVRPVKPIETLHIEADDELRVPSLEQLDSTEDDFEAAYRAAAASDFLADGTPSPTGLAGHDVHQGRPEEGFLVEETEETLPDGTVVKQRVHTAETVQALSAHDWEEAVFNATSAKDGAQYSIEPPEESVHTEEVEETLPDGTVVKKRITTQRITERITEREVTDEISENEVYADGGIGESKEVDHTQIVPQISGDYKSVIETAIDSHDSETLDVVDHTDTERNLFKNQATEHPSNDKRGRTAKGYIRAPDFITAEDKIFTESIKEEIAAELEDTPKAFGAKLSQHKIDGRYAAEQESNHNEELTMERPIAKLLPEITHEENQKEEIDGGSQEEDYAKEGQKITAKHEVHILKQDDKTEKVKLKVETHDVEGRDIMRKVKDSLKKEVEKEAFEDEEKAEEKKAEELAAMPVEKLEEVAADVVALTPEEAVAEV